ncbi:hypothetical protein HCH_02793 [Hahella chejuensis KCTC 2396]|uniref:Uncharacterized protein n=1 Tax=Hahella chejuensis (strain KCTC 2396) TaxID=349521 RepID=Q2SIF2_HAHCH|nr:hypothetical protein HCH_02793 [Hahella chejuensis KCTC 2396]
MGGQIIPHWNCRCIDFSVMFSPMNHINLFSTTRTTTNWLGG